VVVEDECRFVFVAKQAVVRRLQFALAVGENVAPFAAPDMRERGHCHHRGAQRV